MHEQRNRTCALFRVTDTARSGLHAVPRRRWLVSTFGGGRQPLGVRRHHCTQRKSYDQHAHQKRCGGLCNLTLVLMNGCGYSVAFASLTSFLKDRKREKQARTV